MSFFEPYCHKQSVDQGSDGFEEYTKLPHAQGVPIFLVVLLLEKTWNLAEERVERLLDVHLTEA